MAVFTYEGIVSRGHRQRGRVEAEHRDEALYQLTQQGIHVVQIEEVKNSVWTKEITFGRKKIKPDEFVVFCRQFATLIRAGIPVVESLQVLAEQARSKDFRFALDSVMERVTDGTALSESLAQHPKIFPQMFVQMVHAGEVSGTLDDVLESTATYVEKQHETTEKIKSAMVYPVSVSIFSIAVAIFLLVRVIPTFVTVFQDQHLTLPLPTRIILALSFFVTHRWYIVLSIIVVLCAAILIASRNPKNLYLKDKWILRIPVFGTLLQKAAVARTTRTMSMLFRSAVPALEAISITADAVDNRYIASTLRDAREHLQSGESIVEPLRANDAFPPMVTQMIRIGEQTGNLDDMLGKVADFYEADVATMVDRLRQLIEPVMIAFLAVVVGGIVLAALLPMFSLYQGLGNMS
ncbi:MULTISPECIES: type II secretion system F family protein [Alicyclobacillus]|uniref:Type II secretion system F family protein n=1 Tax=Alicyclobacillus acidoterrestris (strain ATCC 49025 / DSM 3922 / CIP 106132 / NCIMB 13137 / GD3B) TaxID=1356854 RepID=T0BJJ0_ALIAG|nr:MULTISPECIES: type II secretion system F family protein [Alicyclobacillus]EPZ44128.1 hypothetical protein N007_11435 [Alicyclobacillus acidoterrestris ATCC 49025]UNO49648.1 type II secretion system F family protein [Alicyclobacillus acidoterrestris]